MLIDCLFHVLKRRRLWIKITLYHNRWESPSEIKNDLIIWNPEKSRLTKRSLYKPEFIQSLHQFKICDQHSFDEPNSRSPWNLSPCEWNYCNSSQSLHSTWGSQGSQIYEVGFFGNQKKFGQIDRMFMPELTSVRQKGLFGWDLTKIECS